MRVSFDGVEFAVGGGARILDGVSLDIAAGSTLAIVGPNGSGKSTVLRCLFRAIAPAAGTASIDGIDVRDASDLARRLAVLAQDESSALDFTVREVVALGRHPHPRDARTDDHLVTESMRAAEVEHLADRSILQLSGGERQRVMIARVLAQDCPVIALDEPINHIDLRHQLGLISRITRSDRTVLITLHDLNLASTVGDTVAVLDRGRVVAAGQPHDVLTPDLVEQVYGVRPTRLTHPVSGIPHLLFEPLPPTPLTLTAS